MGTMVFANFTATDMDSGVNGLVEYFIEDTGNPDDAASHFSIDSPHQGIVTIKKPLDYEQSKVCVLGLTGSERPASVATF